MHRIGTQSTRGSGILPLGSFFGTTRVNASVALQRRRIRFDFTNEMLRRRSHQLRIGTQRSRTRVRITLALSFVTAIAAMKYYMVREVLVVLLLPAVAMLTVLALSVALILSQEGLLWAISWMKRGVTRIALLAGLSSEASNLAKKIGDVKQ